MHGCGGARIVVEYNINAVIYSHNKTTCVHVYATYCIVYRHILLLLCVRGVCGSCGRDATTVAFPNHPAHHHPHHPTSICAKRAQHSKVTGNTLCIAFSICTHHGRYMYICVCMHTSESHTQNAHQVPCLFDNTLRNILFAVHKYALEQHERVLANGW